VSAPPARAARAGDASWVPDDVADELLALVRCEALRDVPADVHAIVAALRERYGADLLGAIYYGSCRRQATPDGVVDLHALLREHPPTRTPLGAVAARLLPPTIAYLEVPNRGAVVRAKVGLLSREQFRYGCSRRAYLSYFWGRYAQPVTLVGFDDPEPYLTDLLNALTTFAWHTLPLARPDDDALGYWRRALAASYASELRPEGVERAAALVDLEADAYAASGAVLLGLRPSCAARERAARRGWWLRAHVGKLVSILRLVKAAATFEGGVDYALWKIERHTGRRPQVSDRVRRWPLVFGWPVLWRLWRDGSLR